MKFDNCLLSKEIMNYEKHVEKKGCYLLVKYTGSLTGRDLPGGDSVFHHLARLCQQNDCDRALLDSRQLSVSLGDIDLFRLGYELAELPDQLIKFAMLGTEEQVPSDNLMENVAVDRGAYLRVFTNEDEAISWLVEDSSFLG